MTNTAPAPAWEPFKTQTGKTGHVQRWPSMRALTDYVRAKPAIFHGTVKFTNDDGAKTHADAVSRLELGDADGAAKARELVDKIAVATETKRRAWGMGVAGAYPVVPAYLSGNPVSMRRRITVRTESAPLRIWMGLTCSDGTTATALRGRAIGAMALALALSSLRHVTVIGFAGMGVTRNGPANFVTVPLNVDTDMAGAFGALAHPVMARFVPMHLHVKHGGSDQIPFPWNQPPASDETGAPSTNPNVRDALGAGPDDALLNAAFVSDNDLIVNNPTEWVRRMLAKHGALAETDEAA